MGKYKVSDFSGYFFWLTFNWYVYIENILLSMDILKRIWYLSIVLTEIISCHSVMSNFHIPNCLSSCQSYEVFVHYYNFKFIKNFKTN